jgi:CheY-like chemotaxis protein
LAKRDVAVLARMADAIAPVLNDQISTIVGRVRLLLNSNSLEDRARESLLDIFTAAETAADVVRQIQLFGNRVVVHVQVRDLNATLKHAATVVREFLGPAVEVQLGLQPGLPLVSIDVPLIEQAILCLARHAAGAMPQGGTFTLSTSTITLSAADAAAHPGGYPGNFVVLTAAHTGTAPAGETIARLFTPFSSPIAPSSGQASLATVGGIARQHGGWVHLAANSPGRTQFAFYLPAASPLAQPQAVPEPPASARGSEVILLVDDDAMVREITAAVLQESGYRILQAASAGEALERWKWHHDRIRLLIADVALSPGLSGPELASQLRSDQPRLPVILISGHGVDIMSRSPLATGEYQFLQKPWRSEALTLAVRSALDQIKP